MARIVMATYMVRYPLGGMLSWALQYCLGLHAAGHHVVLVEKAGYADACFDPVSRRMTDDGRTGLRIVDELLTRFGLQGRLFFRDHAGLLHGAGEKALAESFSAADVYIDIGNHGAWLPEARQADLPTVLIDGEPGYTQIRMQRAEARGEALPRFDHYFSNGASIGCEGSTAPTAERRWHHLFNPVMTDLYNTSPPPAEGCFTTVMNWQSHQPVEYQGRQYGQKDVEFDKFMGLPTRTAVPLEVAAAGKVPESELRSQGWRVEDAHAVTQSFYRYGDYIRASLGEFSVCKQVFVALRTGWFSDRSAAYLASGRPVVLQDTGFSEHLPTGEGLFAVDDVDAAAKALDTIMSDYPRHAQAARAISEQHLDARALMAGVLHRVGL